MTIVTALLLSLQAIPLQARPTLADIQRLSPEAAGNLALAGKLHNPIAEVVVPPVQALQPPGVVDLEMVERPLPTAGGCVRKRWRVSFYGTPTTPGDATLSSAYASTEVALRRTSVCPPARYVWLHPELQPARAFAALAFLDHLRRRRSRVRFTCSDSTSSGLCANGRAFGQILKGLSPWAVRREGDVTIFWLDDPRQERGQLATEVRYSANDPRSITVTRTYRRPPKDGA